MAQSQQSPIVLIHGAWMTPRSWEGFQERYEGRGYEVIAPAWPGLEVEVEALNADPTPLARLRFGPVIDHFDGIVRGLERPPIMMGHSTGGAIVQVLLDRGLGAAGVGISSAFPKGVYDLPLSTLKATRSVLANPFSRGKATPLTPAQFHYAFANTVSREESDAIYRRYAVPCANTLLWELAFANFSRNAVTKVDFNRADRAPLLLIAGDEDHVVPSKASRHNAEKYKSGTVAFTSIKNHPHYPGIGGWEDIADYALTWSEEQIGRKAEGAPEGTPSTTPSEKSPAS
jgi:pimeloyl-ACP methyl ester carboxylesterase